MRPGTGRDGDGIQIVDADPRFIQGLPGHGGEDVHVRPAGQLGNDAAERRMDLVLRRNQARENPSLPAQDGDRRLVAGCLDGKEKHSAISFQHSAFGCQRRHLEPWMSQSATRYRGLRFPFFQFSISNFQFSILPSLFAR